MKRILFRIFVLSRQDLDWRKEMYVIHILVIRSQHFPFKFSKTTFESGAKVGIVVLNNIGERQPGARNDSSFKLWAKLNFS